jgi:Cu+-exporting ATPase
MVTGEPMPAAKGAGDTVIGATVNTTGSLRVRAAKVGADTMLAQIITMVRQAQASRAPVQRLADTVSGYFVPAVIGVAIATFAVWFAAGPAPAFTMALVAAIAVLIIACPCALGLATPLSIQVGTGKGARAGILIRSAEALETAHQLDTVVLDKTGTITAGRPVLTDVRPAGCWPRCCPSTRPARSAACRPRATRSGWSATASTTPRPWPPPTSAWPSAPAPTWRSRPPTSP